MFVWCCWCVTGAVPSLHCSCGSEVGAKEPSLAWFGGARSEDSAPAGTGTGGGYRVVLRLSPGSCFVFGFIWVAVFVWGLYVYRGRVSGEHEVAVTR